MSPHSIAKNYKVLCVSVVLVIHKVNPVCRPECCARLVTVSLEIYASNGMPRVLWVSRLTDPKCSISTRFLPTLACYFAF